MCRMKAFSLLRPGAPSIQLAADETPLPSPCGHPPRTAPPQAEAAAARAKAEEELRQLKEELLSVRADKSRVTHIGKAVLEDIATASVDAGLGAAGRGARPAATADDVLRLQVAEKKLEEAAAAEVMASAAAKVNLDLEAARTAARAANDENARQQAQLGA